MTMSTQEKFLYNMVLRQLREEEDYDDDVEDFEEEYDPNADKFFGEGEVEQMEGVQDEDEVSAHFSDKEII